VLSSCHAARRVEGRWYFSITCFHDALASGGVMAAGMMRVEMESVAMTVLRKLASRATAAQNGL
jgi:hypothetical protein